MASESAGSARAEEIPRAGGLRVRHIMYIVFWSSVCCALISSLGWRPVAIFGVILGIAAGLVLLVRHQASQREAMLEVLEIAAKRRMPLAPGVEAFASMTSGRFRRRVEALATLLRAGLPLPDALDRVPGVVSGEAAVFARVGWEAGALPEALAQAMGDRDAMRPAWREILLSLMYPLVVILAVELASSFMLYFITPKFEAIFYDFGVKLPWLTVQVILVSHSPYFLALATAAGAASMFFLWLLPACYFGWIDWEPKWLDRVFSRRHTTLILRSIAMAIDAGRPLNPTLEALAATYPRAWVRQRLAWVAGFVSQGANWIEALHLQGLIREEEAAVLASAGRAGNLSWALRELADAGYRRSRYRMKALSELIYPLVLLAIGGLVLIYAAAYFLPIVTLIEDLAR